MASNNHDPTRINNTNSAGAVSEHGPVAESQRRDHHGEVVGREEEDEGLGRQQTTGEMKRTIKVRGSGSGGDDSERFSASDSGSEDAEDSASDDDSEGDSDDDDSDEEEEDEEPSLARFLSCLRKTVRTQSRS
jgi:hypothetical protein